MRVPATEAEFPALSAEVVEEFDELALCSQEDLDDETADLAPAFQASARSLSNLGDQIRSGSRPAKSGGNLACMRLTRTYRHVIPFFQLLDSLNRAYQRGFQSG